MKKRPNTFDEYVGQYKGKRASALVDKLTDRLYEVVAEFGTEDLTYFVQFLRDNLDRQKLKALRPQLLEILANDDLIRDASKAIDKDRRSKVKARQILLDATIAASKHPKA